MAEAKAKTRLYLGADATSVDAGRPWKDVFAIRTIAHPKHSMHNKYNPDRYSLGNPQFAALVEVVRAQGVPSPIAVRARGILVDGDPELVYLREAYPDKVRPEEPCVETIYGNSRVEAAKIVLAEGGALRVPCLHKASTDAQAALSFSQENNVRQAHTLLDNVLTVDDALKRGRTYEDLVLELGMPAQQLARLYEPLRGLQPAIIIAFERGEIKLLDVKRIGRYAEPEQLTQLDDCINKRGAWAPKKRPPAKERPLQLLPEKRKDLADLIDKLAADLDSGELLVRVEETLAMLRGASASE